MSLLFVVLSTKIVLKILIAPQTYTNITHIRTYMHRLELIA